MRALLTYKDFFILGIIILTTIIAAYLLGYGLIYSILLSLITGFFTTIANSWLRKVLDRKPMPPIKTYSDYDKNVQEIDRFLEWLVKSEKVCDLVTLYVKDELDHDEINLIANQGLDDPSPMYGPLVFDDFRKQLDKAPLESFEETIASIHAENPDGFRKREDIRSRASFKLDKNGKSFAALYLNWRNKQEFTKEKKKELVSYSKRIFSAVQKIEGVSIKRQSSNNAELRTRRWIDYNVMKFKKIDELIIESIYRFLQDFDRSKLRIEIWRSEGDKFIIKKQVYMTAYDKPYIHNSDSDDDTLDVTWVSKTTRPKILPNNLAFKNKIILPIRLLSDSSKCSGIILIECIDNHFIPEMVKPLCYLADHFSRIEAKKIS